MKNGKATGDDGLPAEVFKNSQVAKDILFEFLQHVWDKECVPMELAMGVFVMIYKKGAPDEFSNYRCICLLNHAYKILSVVLMKHIVKECKWFLSEWQAGFRAARGCRDNIFVLRALYDFVVTGDLKCIITFIDYKAAFDSVSHKFIDKVLKKAKVSRKCRAIFRAIYEAASGKVRVNDTLGKKILSEPFDIQRGVVQGDIVSPVLFILALDLLIQTYDTTGNGVNYGKVNIRFLGYADDAAMAELQKKKGQVEVMSNRLTNVADASQSEADMTIRMDKTYSQHIQKQEVKKVTEEEAIQAAKKFKHQCDFCT